MLFSKSARLASLTCLLLAVTACTNSPNAQQLERTLAADPELETNRPFSNGISPQPADPNRQDRSNGATVQLPADFPSEIPPFEDAQLIAVTPANEPQQPHETRWVTSAPINVVQSFYQQKFQENGWQIVNPSSAEAEASSSTTIEARRDDLLVKIAIAPRTTAAPQPNATPAPSQPSPVIDPAASTEFTIQYQRNAPATAVTPTPSPQAGAETARSQTGRVTSDTANQSFSDLSQAPQELQQYITDLAALGVLPLEPTINKSSQADSIRQFDPGKIVSRREFARWLFEANNRIQATRPSLQIRAASSAAQPAFRDVPRNDPDFSIIQGLAEAGLIPSSLSGSTAVLFRPDAPLTREQLLLWKVPLDTRQALPNASLEAVKEAWGFQDTARIDPKVLRALLADFQNGDQSNIRRVFGYTTLLQPKKPVTRAEAASAIWFFGNGGEGMTAQEALKAQQQPNQAQNNQPPQNQPQPQPTASP